MDTKSNKKLLKLTMNDQTYEALIPIKRSSLDQSEEYYFTLEERESENKIYLSAPLINHDDDYFTFKVIIPLKSYSQTFLEHNIWDLFFNIHKEDVSKKRIKSNYDNLRFNVVVLPELQKMFYPFTTKKGNISFRLNDYFLYAKIDQIRVTQTELFFEGFFNWPPSYKTNEYDVTGLKLFGLTKQNNEIEIPVENVQRKDLFEKFKGNSNLLNSGFKGSMHLVNDLVVHDSPFFKFYLELTYIHNGETYKVRSTRVRLDHLKREYPIKQIISVDNKKMKVRIAPTKENKLLSLKVSQYNFKNEVRKKIKSKWVHIRRGKQLKEFYKYAFYLLGKLPVKKKTIMLESFLGKQYSDSPRAIYEYMQEFHSDYKMFWSADRRQVKLFQDKDVPFIRRFSIKWLFAMARAEYWVSNSRLPLWIPKPKHTTYLQTWHGTPLKRLAADMDEVHMPGTNTEKYKKNFLKEASKWDYLVSPNAYSSEIFKRAFDFSGAMIESGYPRNDFLLNADDDQTRMTILNGTDLPKDKKIILYAPTWRDNQFYGRGRYRFNLEMDLQQLKEKFGEDYIIVLRLHYLVAENLDLSGFEGFVYDMSKHEDIRELYLIADMLITDYSSVFFDYANLKRPMMFFVYDIEDYRDNLRGFYFDFEAKAPGPLVKTTEEIIDVITDIEQNGFKPSSVTEEFYKRFCYLEDGHATERVVNTVFK